MCDRKRSIVFMAVFMAVFGVTASLSLAGCTGGGPSQAAVSGPTAPITPAVPDPNSVLAQSNGPWTLTTVANSVSGPLDCFPYPLRLGVPYEDAFPMTVTRTTTTVTIQCCGIPGNDAVLLVAGMTGDEFAVTVSEAISFPSRCGKPSSTTVTGTFSTDGKHLTALEVDTSHASSGDTIFTVSWTASAGHQ